jgi:hypothetical protein
MLALGGMYGLNVNVAPLGIDTDIGNLGLLTCRPEALTNWLVRNSLAWTMGSTSTIFRQFLPTTIFPTLSPNVHKRLSICQHTSFGAHEDTAGSVSGLIASHEQGLSSCHSHRSTRTRVRRPFLPPSPVGGISPHLSRGGEGTWLSYYLAVTASRSMTC